MARSKNEQAFKGKKSIKAKAPEPQKADKKRTGSFRPKPKHADTIKLTKNDGKTDKFVRRNRTEGVRPRAKIPVILETKADANFALLDMGDGLKLENYCGIRIIRPEAQAIWPKHLSSLEWDKADAVFTGDTDEEGLGRWRFPKGHKGETWPMKFDDVSYQGRFTSFRHVGVFPEQAAHWRMMQKIIKSTPRKLRVLNLFGYTGVASLVAAQAGASVTHIDASKKAITWAHENQRVAQLEERPIRWICEDALKFVQREARRGNTYDIILVDPPAYGRGPNGEVWQLFENLAEMLDCCRMILSKDPLMLVLTAYAIRASFFAMHEIMMDVFTGFSPHGIIESGELILCEKNSDRALSTSMFSRWLPER